MQIALFWGWCSDYELIALLRLLIEKLYLFFCLDMYVCVYDFSYVFWFSYENLGLDIEFLNVCLGILLMDYCIQLRGRLVSLIHGVVWIVMIKYYWKTRFVIFLIRCKLLCLQFIVLIWAHYASWITYRKWNFIYLPSCGVYLYMK